MTTMRQGYDRWSSAYRYELENPGCEIAWISTQTMSW